MGKLSNGIGTFFEERIRRALPGIVDQRCVRNAPDFQWHGIQLEAKVGFDRSDYGCLPKGYEFSQHRTHPPFIYVFGYHDFKDARSRLKGLTADQVTELLLAEAHITRMAFVSGSLAKRIALAESRVDRHGVVYHGHISCNSLIHLMKNDPIERRGVVQRAREYYGFDELACKRPEPIGYLLRRHHSALVRAHLASIDVNALQNP